MERIARNNLDRSKSTLFSPPIFLLSLIISKSQFSEFTTNSFQKQKNKSIKVTIIILYPYHGWQLLVSINSQNRRLGSWTLPVEIMQFIPYIYNCNSCGNPLRDWFSVPLSVNYIYLLCQPCENQLFTAYHMHV